MLAATIFMILGAFAGFTTAEAPGKVKSSELWTCAACVEQG